LPETDAGVSGAFAVPERERHRRASRARAAERAFHVSRLVRRDVVGAAPQAAEEEAAVVTGEHAWMRPPGAGGAGQPDDRARHRPSALAVHDLAHDEGRHRVTARGAGNLQGEKDDHPPARHAANGMTKSLTPVPLLR